MATKQTSNKAAAVKTDAAVKAAAREKLIAKVVALRTGKDKLSFRAIEQKLAKELGLDPTRPFGGFRAFNLFNSATKHNGNGKVKATTKKAAVKKTVAKKAAQPATAPTGAQVNA
jgi:hypothetical protein